MKREQLYRASNIISEINDLKNKRRKILDYGMYIESREIYIQELDLPDGMYDRKKSES